MQTPASQSQKPNPWQYPSTKKPKGDQESLTDQNSNVQHLFCQPCFKRGYINGPAFVNLNQFQNNRYICENCSFGQTYIIELKKNYTQSSRRSVKLQNVKEVSYKDSEQKWKGPLDSLQRIDQSPGQIVIATQEGERPEENVDQPLQIQENQQEIRSSQCQQPINQFVKNIQVNYNDQTKYSVADIGMYTQKIANQYRDAIGKIEQYEKMIKEHIYNWRDKVKVQFQGVIATFSNLLVPDFLKELQQLQKLQQKMILTKQQINQADSKDFQQQRQQNQLEMEKILNQEHWNQKNYTNIKSEKITKISPQQIFRQTQKQLYKQKERVCLFVQILKMSGTRNLSNLSPLLGCCKGFSDAVQTLINLQKKETERRFKFITQKLKVCSIQALYDAQMINYGLLDNKIQTPPIFQIYIPSIEKEPIDDLFTPNNSVFLKRKHFPYRQQIVNTQNLNGVRLKQQQRAVQISLLSSQSQRQEYSNIQVSYQVLQEQKQTKRLQVQSNYKIQPKNYYAAVREQQQKFEKIRLAKLKSKKPFDSALLNQNKIYRDQAKDSQSNSDKTNSQQKIKGLDNREIDLQSSINGDDEAPGERQKNNNKQLPFPTMRDYFGYEKGRNLFQSKIELNEQNFMHFPPPQLYLASVESLTVKYCPDKTEPWELLKALKCFKKLGQLIIEEPKLATKDIIIMIAQYFPKLKSLVIRCSNQFDWEIGKLFQKKMTHLINFSYTDGKSQ